MSCDAADRTSSQFGAVTTDSTEPANVVGELLWRAFRLKRNIYYVEVKRLHGDGSLARLP